MDGGFQSSSNHAPLHIQSIFFILSDVDSKAFDSQIGINFVGR